MFCFLFQAPKTKCPERVLLKAKRADDAPDGGNGRVVALVQLWWASDSMYLHEGHGLEFREAVHSYWHFSKCHKIDYTKTRHPLTSVHVVTCHVAVSMKITGPWTVAGKTHTGPVNLLYIIMFKIRKPEPNSGSVRQKPKNFNGDCMFRKYHDKVLMICCGNATWAIRTQIEDKIWHLTLSDITNKKQRYHVATPLLVCWRGWQRENIQCVTTPRPPAANGGLYLKSNKKYTPYKRLRVVHTWGVHSDSEYKSTLSVITNKKQRYHVATPLLVCWRGWRRENIQCVTTPRPPAANGGFGKGLRRQFLFSQRWTLGLPNAWKWKNKVCPVNEFIRH